VVENYHDFIEIKDNKVSIYDLFFKKTSIIWTFYLICIPVMHLIILRIRHNFRLIINNLNDL